MSVGVRATCQPSLPSSEACPSTTPATLGMPCCSSLVCVCSSVLLSHPRPAPFLLLHCSLWLPRASLCPEHCLEVVRFSYVLRVCVCVSHRPLPAAFMVCVASVWWAVATTQRWCKRVTASMATSLRTWVACKGGCCHPHDAWNSCCSCLIRSHSCFPHFDQVPSEVYTISQGIEQALQGYRASQQGGDEGLCGLIRRRAVLCQRGCFSQAGR